MRHIVICSLSDSSMFYHTEKNSKIFGKKNYWTQNVCLGLMVWHDMIWYDIWYGMIYDIVYDMVWYDIWYMVWYMIWNDIFKCNWVANRHSTHIHTNNTRNDTKQTIQRTQNKQYKEHKTNNTLNNTKILRTTQKIHRTTQKLGSVRAVPRRCGFYPGICLTIDEKARKNLSQGRQT
jgi:hypothetical protein